MSARALLYAVWTGFGALFLCGWGLLVWSVPYVLGGCGGDCPATVPVVDLYPERAAAVERCTGLTGADQIGVHFTPPSPCPTSGMCCLASHGQFPCPADYAPGRTCGAAGAYDEACAAIELPEGCDGALEHELIHGLLALHGIEQHEHGNAVWRCQ